MYFDFAFSFRGTEINSRMTSFVDHHLYNICCCLFSKYITHTYTGTHTHIEQNRKTEDLKNEKRRRRKKKSLNVYSIHIYSLWNTSTWCVFSRNDKFPNHHQRTNDNKCDSLYRISITVRCIICASSIYSNSLPKLKFVQV